ncbi:MAG: hypothetical protein AAF441_23950, partial [Pseudomonadota bacterium]
MYDTDTQSKPAAEAPAQSSSRSLVTVTECPDPAAFLAEYSEPERPLLIKGLARGWPAREKWSSDWLRGALKDNPDVRD